MVETRSLPKAMSFCLSLHTVHKYLKLHSYGVILSLATVVLRRFTVLAYLKCFVGLCKDRLEGLMASPRATFAAHCRTLALLVLLLSYDVSWVVRLANDTSVAYGDSCC